MKKKTQRIMFFEMPVVMFMTLAIFLVSGFSSGLVFAVGGNGGGLFVGSSSTITIDEGTISRNTATDGGGVYVASGGKLKIGDCVYFGSYPQTYQADTSVITTSQDGNEYYIGTDGNRYAKVSANPFTSSYTFNDGTTIVSGTEYYFKVEPLKWRILSTSDGKALLFCENIINAHNYYSSESTRTINGITIYASNYKYSNIRAWLNGLGEESNTSGEDWSTGGFLQTAFTTAEQNSILTTEVDNSASTTNSSSNIYACENTNDKIFLLSYKDMKNTDYGFSSSASEDLTRRKITTDFAIANRAVISNGSGWYWLRSPSSEYDYRAHGGSYNGDINLSSVLIRRAGVVPSLYVDIDKLSSIVEGGTISGNTATSGNGHNIYNAGTFTMTGGTVGTSGTSGSSQTGYGIYNTGTMNLYGGTIHDNIYSETSFTAKIGANIQGTITLSDNATITVEDYSGTTPEYNIILSDSRSDGTILTLQGSSTIPDLTKLNITGYDTNSCEIKAIQGESGDCWKIELQSQSEKYFPSTWRAELVSSDYMTTTVTPTTLTSIIFSKTIPSGYSLIGTLSTGLNVYQSSKKTEIAFVNGKTIYAPVSSVNLFSDLSSLTILEFNNFNTSNVTNMAQMFYNTSNLTELVLTGFETENVTDVSSMFSGCSGLSQLDISSFDLSNVENYENMLNFTYNGNMTDLKMIKAFPAGASGTSASIYKWKNDGLL